MRAPKPEDGQLRTGIEKLAFRMLFNDILCSIFFIARDCGPEDAISFVHDEQKGMKAVLNDAFDSAHDSMRNIYKGHVDPLTFGCSHKLMPLQAADLLAHETRTDLKNKLEQPPRKQSKALERLIASRFHVAFYLDGLII